MDSPLALDTAARAASAAGRAIGVLVEFDSGNKRTGVTMIERLNEEHGIVDLSRCDREPALGERVRILPNHVCVVSNLHDDVAVSRGGRVIDNWHVAARGRTR